MKVWKQSLVWASLCVVSAWASMPFDGKRFEFPHLAETPPVAGQHDFYLTPDTVVALAIAVEFSDQTFAPGIINRLDSLLNRKDYHASKNAAFAAYWPAESQGKLFVKHVVLGPVKMPKPKSYYTGGIYGLSSEELVKSALDTLSARGQNLNQFTQWNLPDFAGGSTKSMVVAAFYVGASEIHNDGSNNGLWPHTYGVFPYWSKGGVTANRYTVVPASPVLDSSESGIYIHESGHLLFGWPDLYGQFSLGRYCLMAENSLDFPQGVNPWLKLGQKWLSSTPSTSLKDGQLVQLKGDRSQVIQIEGSGNQAGQRFLIEAMDGSGSSKKMPGQGVLVWRINDQGENYLGNSTANWIGVAQADGLDQLGTKSVGQTIQFGDQADYYAPSAKTAFDPKGVLSSSQKWADGTAPTFQFKSVATWTSGYQLSWGAGSLTPVLLTPQQGLRQAMYNVRGQSFGPVNLGAESPVRLGSGVHLDPSGAHIDLR